MTAAPPSSGPSPSLRRSLYPVCDAHRSGHLKVSDIHTLYYEESGNLDGKPVLFLHGGPGSGTEPGQRRFFDASFYRIVMFDQRGAGRSRPHACLEENTTWHLVEDIEKLREHLKIDRWLVFGGSWGSTLALAYCQTHPERVTGIVLRGIFLLRRRELLWFYQDGANQIFPDGWEDYLAPIPPEERHDMMAAYYRRMTDPDPAVQKTASRAWCKWEARCSRLYEDPAMIARMTGEDFALAFGRIESHYFVNNGFLRDDQLVQDVHRIRHLPGAIVQGRYDIVCPMESAWRLHRAWPEADFRIVPDAGHSATEHGIVHELVLATERMRTLARW